MSPESPSSSGHGRLRPVQSFFSPQVFELIWLKAVLNLKSEAVRNKLSYVWWLLEPLLYLGTFYIVFTFVLPRGSGGDFVSFLLVGLVVYHWFAKSVQSASTSLLSAQGLLLKVSVTPLFFPAVALLQSSMKQLPVFLLLVLMVLFFGSLPTLAWVALLPLMFAQFLLLVSIGFLLALLVPFMRDLQIAIQSGITFLLFMSGIFYDILEMPIGVRELFLLNPIANLVVQYRTILLEGEWPSLSGILFILGFSGLLLLGNWLLYRRTRGLYAKILVEE